MNALVVIKIFPSHTKPKCHIFQSYCHGEFLTNVLSKNDATGIKRIKEKTQEMLSKRDIVGTRFRIERKGYPPERDNAW